MQIHVGILAMFHHARGYQFDETIKLVSRISNGSDTAQSMVIPPHHPASGSPIPLQAIYPPYQSSPYTPEPSHQTTYMLHSLMDSQKMVLNVVESVSKRLNDLEELVHNISNADPCAKTKVFARRESLLSLQYV